MVLKIKVNGDRAFIPHKLCTYLCGSLQKYNYMQKYLNLKISALKEFCFSCFNEEGGLAETI